MAGLARGVDGEGEGGRRLVGVARSVGGPGVQDVTTLRDFAHESLKALDLGGLGVGRDDREVFRQLRTVSR